MRTHSKENNKNSAAKKIVPAVGMLALSATMLSTSTYAWFTMNKEVEMTGLSMTASVGEGMEIALAEVADDNKITTPSIDTPSDEKINSWGSAVVVGDYYEKIGLLNPASSVDGVKLFDVTKASNSGKKAGGYKAIDTTVDSSKVKTTARITLSEGTAVVSDSAEESKGYYVDIPVHLRTNKTGDGDSPIYCKLIIKNQKIDEQGKYADLTAEEKSELYKAVRVAFIKESGDASGKIFGIDNDYYTDTKAVVDDQQATATANLGDVDVTITDAVTSASFDDIKGVDSGLVIPLAAGAGKYGHLDFTVRVWLEGESESCFNENSGQSWNIDLAFSLDKFDGADSQG